jgi:hypothetical protein
MKLVLAALLTTLGLSSCSHLRESDPIDPGIRGLWSGEGRFLDRDLNEEYGRFPIALEIGADNSVVGTVGVASLTDAVLRSRPDDPVIDGRLDGPVFREGTFPGLDKDCTVFLLQPKGDGAMGGNVHLKTNHTFDFGMRVCGLELTRGL